MTASLNDPYKGLNIMNLVFETEPMDSNKYLINWFMTLGHLGEWNLPMIIEYHFLTNISTVSTVSSRMIVKMWR